MVAEAKRRARVRKEQLEFAKKMRREPTEAEVRFWHYAKNRGIGGLKFRRQVPVGRYVADFLCAEHGLIVEIDGGQHNGSERDSERDRVLSVAGYRVLRFWNNDVMADMEGVGATIMAASMKR